MPGQKFRPAKCRTAEELPANSSSAIDGREREALYTRADTGDRSQWLRFVGFVASDGAAC